MGFNFPNSPTPGQVFAPSGGPQWTWNGYGWIITALSSGIPEAPVDGLQYGRQDADWTVVAGSGGSTDWTDITGKPATFPPTLPIDQSGVANLTTDQAAQNTAIAGKAPTVHSHAQGDITNLTTDLAGKAPTVHTHAQGDITNLTTDLAGKAPTVHSHAQGDITNLTTDMGLKAPLASPVFTGNPTAPTPSAGDEDTSIATTAFVQTAVDSATGAGLFGYFDYTFNSTNYVAPPIAGNFRMNNATQTAVTHIYVHEQTAVGNDAAILLAQIAVGDKLLIQTKTDATKWQRYTVTAVTDMGVYWDFTVTWVNGGSAMGSARTAIVIQKLAAIGEAPNDGLPYVRKGLAWDDFTDDMALKANLASPSLTGTPLSTTAASTVNTTQIATTAFVKSNLAVKVTVASSAPSSPATNDVWIDTT